MFYNDDDITMTMTIISIMKLKIKKKIEGEDCKKINYSKKTLKISKILIL